MTMTQERTQQRTWHLRGQGFEFCNCQPGCTCNFSGFPTSSDDSCQALVGNVIEEGRCGETDLSGLTVAALIQWPKAIHDGGGKAVFVVEPATTDDQISALSEIFTGQLGGNPWAILGTTFDVAGLVKAPIEINGDGLDRTMRIDGVGEGRGRMFRNPVTNETHEAHIVQPDGFIWRKGECGVGDFEASAEGVEMSFQNSNWIYFEFDWAHDR